jgi:transposase-like protein
MIRINRKISDDFKRKVVLEVLAGNLSKEEARRAYDVRGKSAVTDWVRRFGPEFSNLENPDVGLQSMSKSQKTSSVEELQTEIENLRRQLDEERHKAGLYKTMIEIAEERFNIDIRKKSGAKQSLNTKKK